MIWDRGAAARLSSTRPRSSIDRVSPGDTSPDASRIQLEAVRRLGPARRLEVAIAMSEDARRISIEAVKRRHPEYSDAEARDAVLRALYGDDLADKFARSRRPR